MAPRRLPRLTLQDMKDLRQSVAHLVAADETLKSSSWQAAPAVRSLLHSVVMVIGPLYDRAEAVYLEITGEGAAIPEGPEAGELAGGDPERGGPGSDQEEE